MFGSMRRKDRELPYGAALNILENNKFGILSLICENGYPYGVPIHYVMQNGKIYFHSTNAGGMKADAMAKHSQISFTVIEPLEGAKCQSVIVFGTVRAASELRSEILEKIVEKFVPECAWANAKSGITNAINKVEVYEITIENLTAKFVDKPEK